MPTDLISTLFSNVWSFFLVVLFFGGSIFVHELGHFLAARRRGVHVERFSIGFGPPIFSWRGRDGVEYRLAWFPLGGYVLLPQLADLGPIEGRSDVDVSKLPPISYSTRMLVFVAGAVFNLLFALVLATVIWVVGLPESSETATTRIGYVSPTLTLPDNRKVTSPAMEAGVRPGDVVRAIDGTKVTKWQDMVYLIRLGSGVTDAGERKAVFTIERDGKLIDLTLKPILVGEDRDRLVGVSAGYELLVQGVATGSLAEKVGFKVGDEILLLDGVRVWTGLTYFEHLETNAGKPVAVRVKRGTEEVTLTLPPRPDPKQAASFGLTLMTGVQLTHPTPFAQLSEHVTMTFRTLWSLLNPHSDVGLSKVSGPVGIVRIFHSAAEAGTVVVLVFTILVNVNLAIFNLLPIPVLDGGQMLFATIGKLRGRALPPQFIMAAQSAFGVLLIAMVLYVSVFDVRRWARDVQSERAESAAAATKPEPAK